MHGGYQKDVSAISQEQLKVLSRNYHGLRTGMLNYTLKSQCGYCYCLILILLLLSLLLLVILLLMFLLLWLLSILMLGKLVNLPENGKGSVQQSQNTLCTRGLSKGCISNIPAKAEGIQLKLSGLPILLQPLLLLVLLLLLLLLLLNKIKIT